MSKIEVGKFSDLMRRLLSMKGVVEVAQELAPEISPVFILEAERPEWEFIKNQKLCSNQIVVNALGGAQASGQIRNPLNSGVIAIVDLINVSVPDGTVNATVLVHRIETIADLASITPTVCRDTRWPSLNVSALISSNANVALAGDFIWSGFITRESVRGIRLPFVLTPGFALGVNLENVNVTFRANFHWLERRIGELEVAT